MAHSRGAVGALGSPGGAGYPGGGGLVPDLVYEVPPLSASNGHLHRAVSVPPPSTLDAGHELDPYSADPESLLVCLSEWVFGGEGRKGLGRVQGRAQPLRSQPCTRSWRGLSDAVDGGPHSGAGSVFAVPRARPHSMDPLASAGHAWAVSPWAVSPLCSRPAPPPPSLAAFLGVEQETCVMFVTLPSGPHPSH